MSDDDGPADRRSRRVIGRSGASEPRHVVLAPPSSSAGTPAAPGVAGPAVVAAPPRPAPWNVEPPPPRTRTVIGRSAAPATPAPPGEPLRPQRPAGPAPAPRPRSRSRRWKQLLVVGVLLVVMVPMGLFALGWWQFSRIETVPVAAALSPTGGAGTNYLIVGTDSRAGIAPDDPNAGAFLDEGVSGSRTDTIMILRVEGGSTQLLSIPRDLWVTDPATGKKGRINSTFAAGPANLIMAVRDLGIPVQHYLEINFVSFARLVDAVGGITIDVPAPARDANSGLQIDQAGPVTLDGSQALAYVRSRYYEQFVDGRWVKDPTADIGRTERQRAFLTSLLRSVSGTRNPIALFRIPGAVGAGMKIDDRLTYLDALRLGWTLRGASPTATTVPVTPRTTSGGAAVLELGPGAADVFAGFAR